MVLGMSLKNPAKTSDFNLISLFLDMLAAEQGAGANTLDAYRRDLTDFSEHLSHSGQTFVGADTEALRGYLADLDVRGFKSSSVARRLSALRHLYRFLLNERIRSDDPAAILSGPKRGRGLPKVLSIQDVDRMLTRAKELTQTDVKFVDETHTRRMLELEREYLRRHPQRTWQGTDPDARPVTDLDEAKVKDWLGKGAQPTEAVARLLKAKGLAG